MTRTRWLWLFLICSGCLWAGCTGSAVLPDGSDGGTELLKLVSYATGTGGAAGIALRPSDGALFAVNQQGLFGPITQGADLGTMQPIGATNLLSTAIFGSEGTTFVLAISNSGEFWIAGPCCSRLAVVPATGGDAVAFDGLLSPAGHSMKPETLALVPVGFEGANMHPGDLLVSQDTAFSWMSAVRVGGDRGVVDVPNPGGVARYGKHLAFGPGPTLYACRGIGAYGVAGLQTVGTDGLATAVAGSEGLGVKSFVVRSSGDLILRARYDTAGGQQINGVLVFSPASQQINLGVGLATSETSQQDQMVISAARSTIYLSLPSRNEIVTVVDK